MDGCKMRCGIISSCQSAATSEIVKKLKRYLVTRLTQQHCSKYPNLYLYLYIYIYVYVYLFSALSVTD